MRVGILTAYMDYHRRGEKNHGGLQPGIGPVIAGMLPDIDVEVITDQWQDPDWSRDYDLLYISSLHSDFDRARQVSHYWRRRGATTVFGGIMASTYPDLCQPFFDSIVIGDAEGSARNVYDDFARRDLKRRYVSGRYDPATVPIPRYELLAGRHPLPLTVEASRGCPFSCEFCALTGLGTRFHPRPPEDVVRDIRAGQLALRGYIPWYQERIVAFNDNNLGGNPAHLRKLCDALEPLDILWGGPITFNALNQEGMVERMARAGCRYVFVGLETFNPAALSDMKKFQNTLNDTPRLIDRCRANGILLMAGLMLSPWLDDCDYIQSLPGRLRESGLHVPEFICFEGPIPGTPYFERLADDPEPAFIPHTFLRDITGYTLAVRTRKEPVERFVEGYRWLLSESTGSRVARLRKLADDVPRLVFGGGWETALVDLRDHLWALGQVAETDRTYVAGTDRPPPEATGVPFTANDFDSNEEYRSITEPWRMTDGDGRVLPIWRGSLKVFDIKGRVTPRALEASGLVAT
jgi:radical SAM family protein